MHIPGNRLLNIDAVFSLMPALDLLDVRENRIPEAAKIAPAASLPELIILRVRGNPLCDDDAYADAILGTSHTARTDSVCVPMFTTVLAIISVPQCQTIKSITFKSQSIVSVYLSS